MDEPVTIGTLFGVMSLAVSMVSILVAGFAIWLSWKFWKTSIEHEQRSRDIMSKIETHSKVAETTSREFALPMLQQLLQATAITTERSLSRLMGLIKTESANADPEWFSRFESKLKNLIYEIKQPLEALKRGESIPEASLGSGAPKPALAPEKLRKPWSGADDLASLIRFISEKEGTLPFISVKFLRERYFSDPMGSQLLQGAIDQGILQLSKIENPLKPLVMTTICKLNRAHPKVKEVLGDE